jgi:hypothetical protein
MRIIKKYQMVFYKIVLIIFSTSFFLVDIKPTLAEGQTDNGSCHFAITTPLGVSGYDLSVLGVGSYYNWGVYGYSSVPGNIEHVAGIHVKDGVYDSVKSNLPTWVAANPGKVWIIGNEPDTWHSGQDNVVPEVYAERFYELATMIKSIDVTSQIGFAPIVQPTPIRIRYLNRVLDRLDDADLAGSRSAAFAMIDIYTPHAFILNEQPGSAWGAGIPPGFSDDYADAIAFPTDFDKTHDINTFKEWVRYFRRWMKDNGEQNKPLWITEYGSLFPPLDPPDIDFVNVSDEDSRDYMLDTFDFMLEEDSNLGNPTDGNRLVQRWFWWSLNWYRDRFGGALYDPITKQRTIIGDAWIDYNPTSLVAIVDPDVYPYDAKISPLKYTEGSGKTSVDYLAKFRIGNNISSDVLTNVSVEFSVNNISKGIQTMNLPKCAGSGLVSFNWDNVPINNVYNIKLIVTLNPYSTEVDRQTSNNTMEFAFTSVETPYEVFIPLITR